LQVVPTRRGQLSSSADSKLGRLRVERGLSQGEMAELTGLSDSDYWRLEHNKSPHDINLRALVNCSKVLRVELDEVIEDDWRAWYVFDARRPGPPEQG
jgi:transcriptional regulator with XRE-family HTH domain